MKSYRAWQEQSRSFAALALYNDATFNLTQQADAGGQKPERVEAGVIFGGIFAAIGYTAAAREKF